MKKSTKQLNKMLFTKTFARFMAMSLALLLLLSTMLTPMGSILGLAEDTGTASIPPLESGSGDHGGGVGKR